MEELARRQRQGEESAEQEHKPKEQALRDRQQQEMEMRARGREKNRALFLNSRDGDAYSDAGSTTRANPANDTSEPERRQFDSPTSAISRGRYSYSTTHLVPPTFLSPTQLRHFRSQPPSPVDEGRSSTADHADFCGCTTCSASKYKIRNTPSAHDLRPPQPPITLRPEKPKGWIRRLSMPVGNAFSLDSKKSNPALKNGLATGEDGRIRSFEQSNRSMSNLRSR